MYLVLGRKLVCASLHGPIARNYYFNYDSILISCIRLHLQNPEGNPTAVATGPETLPNG
jgi:hypothetical protein